MKFSLSREKFETLEADARHADVIKDFTENEDGLSGSITTHDVTISYNYDPQRQELNFEVGARHSLAAHMASDNIIYNHIVKVLSNLVSAPAVPDKSPLINTGSIAETDKTQAINTTDVGTGTVGVQTPKVPEAPVKTIVPIKPIIPAQNSDIKSEEQKKAEEEQKQQENKS